MALGRLTQTFTQLPWAGGYNSSVDQGVLPPNNITFILKIYKEI